jgi:hypothetical protein
LAPPETRILSALFLTHLALSDSAEVVMCASQRCSRSDLATYYAFDAEVVTPVEPCVANQVPSPLLKVN